jgi:pimeloyl-ACP methyl ester carboxylesterase
MFREGFRQGSRGWLDDWVATFEDWGFRLADVTRPVAVWRGDEDRLSTATDSERLAGSLPAATLRTVPGGGHSLATTHWRPILDSVLDPRTGDADHAGAAAGGTGGTTASRATPDGPGS